MSDFSLHPCWWFAKGPLLWGHNPWLWRIFMMSACDHTTLQGLWVFSAITCWWYQYHFLPLIPFFISLLHMWCLGSTIRLTLVMWPQLAAQWIIGDVPTSTCTSLEFLIFSALICKVGGFHLWYSLRKHPSKLIFFPTLPLCLNRLRTLSESKPSNLSYASFIM